VSFSILEYQGAILVDHSAYGYLLDTSGKTRLQLPYDMTAEQITADVRGFIARK
jgi:cytochrome oxidase Cu insertion factor (SCO1/SenC/PrrC family)